MARIDTHINRNAPRRRADDEDAVPLYDEDPSSADPRKFSDETRAKLVEEFGEDEVRAYELAWIG